MVIGHRVTIWVRGGPFVDRARRDLSEESDQMSITTPIGPPHHPALLAEERARAENVQNRVADRITIFAGSMAFVYIHVVWFGAWIVFGVEHYPYGLLTMIVSLEAIFLSTFVMISQNRADAKRQVLADHQWQIVQTEEKQNEDLLDVSRQILALTQSIHELATRVAGAALPPPGSTPTRPDTPAG
jgi:uncharacterized membrane protein